MFSLAVVAAANQSIHSDNNSPVTLQGEGKNPVHDTSVIVFSEDFSDGIWTKYACNPVMVRSQPWAESQYICEPNIIYKDSLFRMWFSQMYPPNKKTALGYATSRDGFNWTKYPGNPVLSLNQTEVHRPSVMLHDGTFYLFAVDDETGEKGPSTMRRWSSGDGINWDHEQLIMTANQPWENNGLCNMSVIVDKNGRWHMLYTSDTGIGGKFGYAWSDDGESWKKYDSNPVIRDFYGGDPFLIGIDDWLYTWHSELVAGSLRIYCRCSRDMVNWKLIDDHPQINYTQLWERGVSPEAGGTAASYYGHLTDATLCEAMGRIYFVYQGAQTPLGVATFDGTLTDLSGRLQHPPLSRWEPSSFGMVEDGMLKLADNGSDLDPLVVKIPDIKDRYDIQTRIRCYAGPTHHVSLVFCYADSHTFARIWLHDIGQIFYQECLYGLLSLPVPIGSAPICDEAWHDWEVGVNGSGFKLTIDKQPAGEGRISAFLLQGLSEHPVHVGFSTYDTWVNIAYLRVYALEKNKE